MTPIPLDLPLRPSEAAEVASLVFSLAERKPLNDELRSRVTARLAALQLEGLRPWPGSLERDPVHHSTYYMAVDGEGREPLLLHMAPAAAPTSAIFPKALLIGRMRGETGLEIVLNSIPFGPAGHENIERFVTRINPVFLPRAQAARAALAVPGIPAAFDGFRRVLKARGRNLAAIAVAAGQIPRDSYYAGLWAAIRAGWREGFSAGFGITLAGPDLDPLHEVIREAAPFTRFAIDVSALLGDRNSPPAAKYGEALKAAERAHELIRQARAARRINRPFDFELSFEHAAPPTAAEDLTYCLDWLKARGHAAQLAAPAVTGAFQADLPALAAAARSCQCTLSLDARAGDPAAIGRATAGRINYRLAGETPDYANYIVEMAGQLFG